MNHEEEIGVKLHIGGEEVKEGWHILNAQMKPGVNAGRKPRNFDG